LAVVVIKVRYGSMTPSATSRGMALAGCGLVVSAEPTALAILSELLHLQVGVRVTKMRQGKV